MGRAYILLGLVCVVTLQRLVEVVGKGSGGGPSLGIQLVSDFSSGVWLASTACAVRAARGRRFAAHRRWALRSFAALGFPLLQRVVNFIAAPCVMVAASVWAAAAGGGGGGDADGSPLRWAASWAMGAAPRAWAARWRSGEEVWSLRGYGVAEHRVFSLSAWVGLASP
eukprot:gene1449-11411_t